MTFGKTIRIYLKDGHSRGIKFGEILNQTIEAISCPRVKLPELKLIPASKKPGVYFLFGQDANLTKPKAYIGEAENVYDRLRRHSLNKDFWNEVLIFVSKDENLTKGHIRYLESRIIETARIVDRYTVDNSNQTQHSPLSIGDKEAMEELLTSIEALVETMGHKILAPLIQPEQTNYKIEFETSIEPVEKYLGYLASRRLYLSLDNIAAKSVQTNEGMVVLAGSEAVTKAKKGLGFGYREIRERLIKNGQLKLEDEKYVFQKDVLLNSPSTAATTILGYAVNGRLHWKDLDGRSLKEIEQEK